MSDTATAGSVTPPASAGTPAAPQAPVDNGSAAGTDNPFSGLSEGTRSWVETKGLKSVEDIAKQGQESEQKLGSMFSVPKPDAAPEEWDKTYSRLGRPDSADKYDFKRPADAPADLPYSDELASAAKPAFHKAGLNGQQAQVIHDFYVGEAAKQMAAQQAAMKEAVETTHDALVKEWGGPQDSEAFKEKFTYANRAAKKLGLVDDLKAVGFLLPDGSVTRPQMAKALAVIGEKMFREDTQEEGGGMAAGANPFKRDAKGQIPSVSAISALYKSDSERAKRLAREAGEDLRDWFPDNPR